MFPLWRDLKDDTLAIGSATQCHAIDIATGIDNQVAPAISSVAAVGEVVNNAFCPAPLSGDQLENRTLSRRATLPGVAIEITVGVEHQAGHRLCPVAAAVAVIGKVVQRGVRPNPV